jgi:hypothetical protein
MQLNQRSFDPPPGTWGGEDWYWGGDPDPLSGQSSLSMFNLNQVHIVTTGESVLVAIIDTGLWTGHPAVQGRFIQGPYSKPQITDLHGHGTAVAGLALAMAPDATVLPINVFGGNPSASPYDVANGLQTALDYGADVVCMAIYSNGSEPVVDQKLQALADAGVFLVACAGNTNGGAAKYPASYGPVISVGATDENDVLASFSASGTSVEFAAVGVGLETFWLPDESGNPMGVTVSGTSASTGLVAGYCALAVKRFKFASYSEIYSDMIDNAIPVAGVFHGRVDTDMFLLPLPPIR